MLEDYASPFDATVVERIEAAGGIVLGKTNLDEFAMGSSSEHCAWGPVRNPADPSRVPGGSSGGSAVAVAAEMADAALGSDTGGSIRQPAALCGCVGFKPTYGRVSRWGLVAFGSSLDQIGPLTKSVRDAALLYSVLAGNDPRDSTSASAPIGSPLDALDRKIDGLRIGVVQEHLSDQNHPAVNNALQDAIERFRGAGAEIIDIDLPLAHHGLSTYYVIAPAEASSNLARYDGIRYGHRAEHRPGDTLEDMYARTRGEGFGTEVKRRIMLGTYLLSAGYHDEYYVHALKARRLIKREYDSAFERCDVLLGPTTPTPAFQIGQTNDPLAMYLNDIYTVNANIAGICAISIPAATVEVDGAALPIGLQLQAQAFDEWSLFRAASAAESLLR
jgi:aspartyl-tRNA(Asn)/glutamyl-tRNA(Gln) amidotransferase subunit A